MLALPVAPPLTPTPVWGNPEHHVTLGELIKALELADRFFCNLNPVFAEDGYGGRIDVGRFTSYRGAYDELAIVPTPSVCVVEDMLARARQANGALFTGYKGGEYRMGLSTPLWVAAWGSLGLAVTDIVISQSLFILKLRED